MIIEINVAYKSPCGTTDDTLICTIPFKTDPDGIIETVQNQIDEWYVETVTEEFSTYFKENGGGTDYEYENQLDDYFSKTELFIDVD